MGRAKFSQTDFLTAALAIAAERGPPAVTVASITERLSAPTGSFYYRFASRNVLLGALWLRTVLDFQQGITAALDAGDGLGAALHTPAWARAHLDEVRLAQFLIAEVPIAAVRQHLVRREPPPPLVDRSIRVTYRAIVADYRARKTRIRLAE